VSSCADLTMRQMVPVHARLSSVARGIELLDWRGELKTIGNMGEKRKTPASWRRLLVPLLLVATLAPAGVWLQQTNGGRGLPIDKRIELVKECLSGGDEEVDGVSSEKEPVYDVTSDEWSMNSGAQTVRNRCAVDALGLPRDGEEVTAIMTSLIAAAEADPEVQTACHEIGHELGIRTWNELQSEGLVLGLELCTYGYYHGFMRAAITSAGGKDRVGLLVDFCNRQAREQGEFNDTRLDFCAHGVGHAIGSALWDLDESVELCEEFPVERLQASKTSGFPDGGVAGWCATGVFNEWFKWPWSKGIETVPDAIKQCDVLPEVYALHCAQYTVHNSMLDIEKIKDQCSQYNGAKQAGCYQGAVQILVRKVLFPEGENRGLSYYTEPEKGAALIDEVCAGDGTGNCARQFAADSMSTTQSPRLVRGVCEKLARPTDRERCSWQVEGIINTGVKYLD
jgi:hypothetical protein